MNEYRRLLAVVMIACWCGHSYATTFPASISRESYDYSKDLDKLSVGADYESISRDIEPDNFVDIELKAESYAVFAAYDILGYYSLFFTVGGSEAELAGIESGNSSKIKWSVGVSGYPWYYDIEDPGFLAGRLSIKLVAEFARYESEVHGYDVEWIDVSAVMLFGYELTESASSRAPGDLIRLAFSAGPALSVIEGTYRTADGDNDFDADNALGLIGGADLYLAHNFSIGAHATVFERTTVSGRLRYHF